MGLRVAINGYGRIGRCVLRALYESGHRETMQVVAINEPAHLETVLHLTRYDSTHGRFPGTVSLDRGQLRVNDDTIAVSCETDLSQLNWRQQHVDLVLECSGTLTKRCEAEVHCRAGARRVMFSCPADREVDATIVYGLNHHTLTEDARIISSASCTTNCITHVIKVLDEEIGILSGVITTIHSMMNDQPVIDGYHHPDLRRSRSAGASIIPVTTALAKGIDRLLPSVAGRFRAVAVRVPTPNVSLMQLTARVKRKTDACQVNAALKAAAESHLSGIMGFTMEPLVSGDYNHDARSTVVDGIQTAVAEGNLVTVMAWFDNEWGYANRMLDTAAYWSLLSSGS
ncbi:MAG: erythrose-4-phosphate dehydrogenase [Deltaproteobacteria bacterium]|nr:MAG: erythrose-4-phosphate dehydrogenase [Deltaproteobacteria bacterium]